MKLEIKIPDVGESVREALLAQWYKRSGDRVRKDEVLFVIETDKVTLEIAAEEDGVLEIVIPEGETVAVGAVVGFLQTAAELKAEQTAEAGPTAKEAEGKTVPPEGKPAQTGEDRSATGFVPVEHAMHSPAVLRLAEEKGVDLSRIGGTGPAGRVTRGDVLLQSEAQVLANRPETAATGGAAQDEAAGELRKGVETTGAPESAHAGKGTAPTEEGVSRKPMSRIRMRIAERLLEARRNTAMLTTFNEIDMSRVQETRSRYKESFRKKHGIGLGFMSFFVKASVQALKEYPEVNAFIEGKEIVYHHYVHIGVAVGGERGLVVPVIRDADRLTFAEIERAIAEFVKKIAENRLDLSDLEGGTFTISNGGVYGSLLSTPILNSPQSGILGMHKIEDRPVVLDGRIVARPMMYVALSYDHRIIDGREAVGFLKRIKECVEDPERMLIEV
jgi:2-oxoglutarate dehydrogenase E2 component (dihydrolipoamide succinyltransferase)